ncbi:MAG: hydroxyethylthiazole kinase [Ancalomicrobiaceae bacterium]|nr:hydroxyethylthiazole kinase [Ancalomicrobiaceae bacterium]
MTHPTTIAALLASVRAKRPLVQNITNYVAMTISANVLLALGASPAMVHAADEVGEFGAFTDSLVINIGTLSAEWIGSMQLAAAAVTAAGRPFVLDPVACGATRLRTEAANALLKLKPAVVRGNAGEIMALAGSSGAQSKGVDSLVGADAAIEAAVGLARASGAVVAITGETDYVTDGLRIAAITGGHALMPLSTAIGCALTGVVGAFVTVADPFEATVAALSVYAAAGSQAGERSPNGPGHLPAELCDALYSLDAATIAARSTVTLLR